MMLGKEDIRRLMGRNLARLRKGRGLTQEQLGARIQSDASHIAQMEGGRGIGLEVLSKLCGALQVNAYEFYLPLRPEEEASGRPEMLAAEPQAAYFSRARPVPVIGRAACRGWKDVRDPGYPAAHAETYAFTDSDDPQAFCALAEGEHMTGFQIEEGDHLLIEPGLRPESGDLVLALHPEEEPAVRKYVRRGEMIELWPGHERFAPLIAGARDERRRTWVIAEIRRKMRREGRGTSS